MKKRILIVDDDRQAANMLIDIFTVNGYLTDGAYSGKEALKMIKGQEYDCVLSDIKMSEMNGVELMRAVKKMSPGIPFVLMTAYTDDELLFEGIREGALVTMVKPLQIETLIINIAQILK